MSTATAAAPASGGSRAQRRNKAKARFASQQQQGPAQAEEDPPASAAAKEEPVIAADEEPAKKKTKKEKKREKRRILEEQQTEQQQVAPSPASAPQVEPEVAESRKRARDAVESGRRLFVGHLPQSTTEAELVAFFDGVVDVEMMRRHDSGRFKGTAFVTLADAAATKAALALNGRDWKSAGDKPQKIVVQHASAPKSQNAGGGSTDGGGGGSASKKSKTVDSPAPSLSVFLGNLPSDVSERIVRDALRACGKIQKVRLLPPHVAEPDKRSGFVDFQSLDASAAAVKLSGTALIGGHNTRQVTVGFSLKAAPPSGGGRRSQEAKRRRRAKRDEQRQATGDKAGEQDESS